MRLNKKSKIQLRNSYKGSNYLKAQIQEAAIFLWQKQPDKAMKVYDRLIKQHPDNTDLLFARAVISDRIGNFDQFEKDLRRVIEINPKHVNALNSLGYTLARYQESYNLLKQAIDLDLENPNILDSFGWVLYKIGKYEESLEHLRKAYAKSDKLNPETAAHLGVKSPEFYQAITSGELDEFDALDDYRMEFIEWLSLYKTLMSLDESYRQLITRQPVAVQIKSVLAA